MANSQAPPSHPLHMQAGHCLYIMAGYKLSQAVKQHKSRFGLQSAAEHESP